MIEKFEAHGWNPDVRPETLRGFDILRLVIDGKSHRAILDWRGTTARKNMLRQLKAHGSKQLF